MTESASRLVIFGVKLSAAEAAECDAAKGPLTRSEWGREALLAKARGIVPSFENLQLPPAEELQDQDRVCAARRATSR